MNSAGAQIVKLERWKFFEPVRRLNRFGARAV
jgi:hypothetical protein